MGQKFFVTQEEDLTTPDGTVREYLRAIQTRDHRRLGFCLHNCDEDICTQLVSRLAFFKDIEFDNVQTTTLSQTDHCAVVSCTYDQHLERQLDGERFDNHHEKTFNLTNRKGKWLIEVELQ